MEDRRELLREAIIRSRRETQGGRWRCPKDLRREITTWAMDQRGQGHGISTIAAQVGMSRSGLARWLPQPESRTALPGFRPIRVDPLATGSELVLISPSGYRVEGLSIEAMAELLTCL